MKKSILFLACASLIAGSAAAQDAKSLFDQGKAAIEKYDKMEADFQLIKIKDPNAKDEHGPERAAILMEGVKMLNQALKADTIIEVDKKTGEPKIDNKTGKPKFKVKYSKEIQDMMVSHIGSLGNSGDIFFQAEDYTNAFVAYQAYANALKSPLAKERGISVPESDFGQIVFMQAYAAYQTKDFVNGYALAKEAMSYGFDKFGVGDVKNSCVANIVQNLINEKKYDEANAYIDGIIASDNSGFVQDIKGFVVEQQNGENGLAAAEEYYKKAMAMDPNFGNSYFDYGRCLIDKATKIIDNSPNATNKELAPKLVPIYKEALEVLKKAKELAPDTAAGRLVDAVEYQLEQLGAK